MHLNTCLLWFLSRVSGLKTFPYSSNSMSFFIGHSYFQSDLFLQSKSMCFSVGHFNIRKANDIGLLLQRLLFFISLVFSDMVCKTRGNTLNKTSGRTLKRMETGMNNFDILVFFSSLSTERCARRGSHRLLGKNDIFCLEEKRFAFIN